MTAKVLYVEDEAVNVALVARILKSTNWELITAADGPTGLKKAASEVPDLILMDLKLPGDMNGLDVTAQIKASPELRHIPIVVITAEDVPTMLQCLEAGCSDHMGKPISVGRLLKTMQQYSLKTM